MHIVLVIFRYPGAVSMPFVRSRWGAMHFFERTRAALVDPCGRD